VRPVVDPLQRIGRRIELPRAPEGAREAGCGVRRVFRDGPTLRSCLPSRAAGLTVAEATGPAVRCRAPSEEGPSEEGEALQLARSAPRCAHRGGPPRGKECPVDVVARWTSPPPSATLARLLAQGAGPRGSADRAARSPVKMNVRAPRDLGAVLPDGRPVRAARHRCRASSLGVVQRTPLHRGSRRVHSRPGVSARPSGRGDQPRPRSALVVSHHLDGLLLLDPAGLLHPAADPGVHRVSTRRETGFLAMLSRPSKPCSPPAATSRVRREVALAPSTEPWGRVTARALSSRCVHREPLPS
jgi:hypothetical protein